VKRQPLILDSYSIIAYLENEPGAASVIELFKVARDSATDVLLCLVNWGEVYYITRRELGADRAEEVATLLTSLPIDVVGIDLGLTKIAAELKARHKMSYADCFAAALAKLHRGRLVTGDDDFRQVEKEISIEWID
jgi:ribonuclease VapC